MGLNKLKLVFEKNIVIKVVRVLIVIGYCLSELCPNKGMPLLNSAGNAQRCASTMDCGDGTYSCQSSNIDGYKYCCPAKLLITGTVIYYKQNYDPISFACLQICIHDYPHWSKRCVIFSCNSFVFLVRNVSKHWLCFGPWWTSKEV